MTPPFFVFTPIEEENPIQSLGFEAVPDAVTFKLSPIVEYSGANDDTNHISAFIVHTTADVHQNPVEQCYNDLESEVLKIL